MLERGRDSVHPRDADLALAGAHFERGLGLTGGVLDAGALADALVGVLLDGERPARLLQAYSESRRAIFLKYTNEWCVPQREGRGLMGGILPMIRRPVVGDEIHGR